MKLDLPGRIGKLIDKKRSFFQSKAAIRFDLPEGIRRNQEEQERISQRYEVESIDQKEYEGIRRKKSKVESRINISKRIRKNQKESRRARKNKSKI